MSDRLRTGREAEDRAADHLLGKGYTLITRRRRTGRREIDLVCLDGETIVFVEVRAKMAPGWKPEESIGPRKLQSFRKAAHAWLRRMDECRDVRFDIVAIDRFGLRHYEDVFNE